MADNNHTALELKGLLLAVIAGLLVVGLAFFVAGLVRNSLSPAERVPVGGAPAATAPGPSQPLTTQMVATGGQFFQKSCASCHGSTGAGGVGPDLHALLLPDARIAHVIKNGKGSMPPFGNQYSDSQISEIVGYVRTLK